MDDLGSKLKKIAIYTGIFLLLVALLQGPQEAAGMGKEIVIGLKTGLTSLIVFGREMIKTIKE